MSCDAEFCVIFVAEHADDQLERIRCPGDAQRNGVMRYDSACCGKTGQEITTYDSLDVSLGQARSNLYLAGKTWAAYINLGHIFTRLGWSELAEAAEAGAARTAATVTANMKPEEPPIRM